jgi:tetratricopeptide (TPR) repeat protein
MARAAVKAKQAQKAQKAKASPAKAAPRRGRRRHASGGNPNQQLFFVRMRRSAKPMYLILAVLFAVTFAFLGVGSGSSGLESLFSNLNIFHHGTSISAAQKRTQKHPNDPKAWRALATAYEGKSDTASAITALQQYTTLRPKDAAAYNELAGLQVTQAQGFLAQYQNAYTNAQLAAPSALITPNATSKLGKALGTNPIEQAAATQQNATANGLYQQVQLAYSNAVSAYQKVANLEPGQASAWLQLGETARQSGDAKTAISAYKRFLKLNTDPTVAAQVKQLIKQLGG